LSRGFIDATEAGSNVVWMQPPSSNPTPNTANFQDADVQELDLQDPDLQNADSPNTDFHEAIINPSPYAAISAC
jgi:hypothetical protein